MQFTKVLGTAGDAEMGERLHALSHDGKVEYLTLDRADMSRRRLRATTDRGTECTIALPRAEKLANGTVLHLSPERAVVVRMREEDWLDIEGADAAAALELGYLAGNLHWRVRFEGTTLKIALEGPESAYLARLAPLMETGRARKAGS